MQHVGHCNLAQLSGRIPLPPFYGACGVVRGHPPNIVLHTLWLLFLLSLPFGIWEPRLEVQDTRIGSYRPRSPWSDNSVFLAEWCALFPFSEQSFPVSLPRKSVLFPRAVISCHFEKSHYESNPWPGFLWMSFRCCNALTSGNVL